MMYGSRIIVETAANKRGIWSEEAIRRLVENLVSNAVKYGHHSAPISVRALCKGERVFITVHNEGTAIPVEEQERLFDRFHRTSSAILGGKRGWGIGLAVCRGIVNTLGGELRVSSTEPAGTTFEISLPLDSRKFQNEDIRSPSGERKVLVVDDAEATRFILKRLLEREKYRVFEAASGTDALAIAKAERPHLIILNANLADMSGLEVCRLLRSKPYLSETRIIETLATIPDDSAVEEMLEAGADDYFVHPVNPEDLLKKVAEFTLPVHQRPPV
jgi:CheY-like chemotaxis protein